MGHRILPLKGGLIREKGTLKRSRGTLKLGENFYCWNGFTRLIDMQSTVNALRLMLIVPLVWTWTMVNGPCARGANLDGLSAIF